MRTIFARVLFAKVTMLQVRPNTVPQEQQEQHHQEEQQQEQQPEQLEWLQDERVPQVEMRTTTGTSALESHSG